MSHKFFTQVLVLVLILLAFFGTPLNAQAGGVCGGPYVVAAGDTLETIAAMCGTTVSAIYAANPGIGASLSAGQTLIGPGSNYIVSGTPIPTTPTPAASVSSNIYNNTYNYYNYPAPVNNNYPQPVSNISNNGSYVVQVGDTFSGIASRFGVSLYALWAANPNIWDINFLYAGQVIYVPASTGQTGYTPNYPMWGPAFVPTPTEVPVPLSYGTVPTGTAYGAVMLSNKSSGDAYVSLQGTTRDGTHIINEYPVSRSMKVKEPAGWYVYVAWVGGQKYEGQFSLSQGGEYTLTFYNNKTVGQ